MATPGTVAAGDLPGPASSPVADAMEQAALKMGGERIEADFMGAEPSEMDASGAVRYRIRARAEMGSEIRRFVGEWLDEDPTLTLMQTGNKVTVIVDPSDPSRYQVVFPPPAS